MSLNVVILAAGMGKRMRSRMPKVLHQLAGRALLSHVIDTARELAPSRIVVVYGHGGERVREAASGDDLAFALQEPQLGTGHAVQQAVDALADVPLTLVLYGDVPLTRAETLRRLIEGTQGGVAVLTAELDDPTGYGRIVRESGAVTAIVEEKDASEAVRRVREVNTGLLAIPTDHLRRWLGRLGNDNAQGEYYLTDVVKLAIGDGIAVHAVQVDNEWETLGVNSRVQLAELERIHQRETAYRLLESGVTLADPARLDVRGRLECASDVTIDVNCVFEGEVRLAEGVHVGPHCVLRNVSVGAGARIEAFSHLDDAVIGDSCRIGPYARVRPGTRLAADVHIGNFVEVKASDIAEGSKANHLAYIGDSTVGRNVNVGAGTITCNYDGAFKHRTVIEDDVFIGSDTQLVAPVVVRRGATIGAGTTVTREVAEGELVLSRTKQIGIQGWQRPQKTGKR